MHAIEHNAHNVISDLLNRKDLIIQQSIINNQYNYNSKDVIPLINYAKERNAVEVINMLQEKEQINNEALVSII